MNTSAWNTAIMNDANYNIYESVCYNEKGGVIKLLPHLASRRNWERRDGYHPALSITSRQYKWRSENNLLILVCKVPLCSILALPDLKRHTVADKYNDRRLLKLTSVFPQCLFQWIYKYCRRPTWTTIQGAVWHPLKRCSLKLHDQNPVCNNYFSMKALWNSESPLWDSIRFSIQFHEISWKALRIS